MYSKVDHPGQKRHDSLKTDLEANLQLFFVFVDVAVVVEVHVRVDVAGFVLVAASPRYGFVAN